MGHEIVPIVVFSVLGLVGMSFSPMARALARRIAGEGGAPRDAGEVDALAGDVAELRRELDEVHNRLDFAERLLGQVKERGLLNAPKEH